MPLQGQYNFENTHGPLQGGFNGHVNQPLHVEYNIDTTGPPQGGYNSNVQGQLQGRYLGQANGPPDGGLHGHANGALHGGYQECVPGAIPRGYNGNFAGPPHGGHVKGHASQHISAPSRSINTIRDHSQNRRNIQPRIFQEQMSIPPRAQRNVSSKQEMAFIPTNNVLLENLPKIVTPQIITECLKAHNLIVKQCTIEFNAEKKTMMGRVEFQNSSEAKKCCQLASIKELKCGDQILAASLSQSNSSLHRGQNNQVAHRESRRFMPY